MTNQLLEERPGIGHNRGPSLTEEIAETLARFEARRLDILETARLARCETEQEAESVNDTLQIMRAWSADVDEARDALKRPYLEAGRQIDRAFGAVLREVELARAGPDGKGGLWQMLDAYRRRRDAIAKATGVPATPIRSALGQVGTRREPSFKITDLGALVRWMLKHHAGSLEQAARTIIGKYLRGIGVEVIETSPPKIPGLEVWIERQTTVRS